MMNSAEQTGVMLISQIGSPFRISFCDVVVRSHAMKKTLRT